MTSNRVPTKPKRPRAPRRADGQRITVAPCEQIERYRDIGEAFMQDVFGLGPGDYLVTDESTLLDFTDWWTSDTALVWAAIEARYGIGRKDVGSEILLHLYAAISRRRGAN